MIVAWAIQEAEPAAGGGLSGLIPTILFLLVFIALFYFMLIWPQRRRQKQHRELLENLKRGDQVVTSGGIVGTVKRVDKDEIILEVEEGMSLKVLKGAIVERRQ
ncbi:MAG: preprotein translocase subunit YajC [Candidatus Acetothermia bacterium]|nr:preprotein translocase subunit YajC [Candidatus Acetothermia bacterium]MDH7505621.1 preprotein translocase subunit YajC [Candidatus Acetothermia bacterium]